MGAGSPLGAAYERLVGHPLAFSFEGLQLASVLFNIPFAIVPMLRAFEGVGEEVLQAARSCGMTPGQAFYRVELPLAWPGVVSGLVLTAAHTLGEFRGRAHGGREHPGRNEDSRNRHLRPRPGV